MWNEPDGGCTGVHILPLRFLLLLISTPIRLITQRGRPPKRSITGEIKMPELAEAGPHQWLAGSIESVTDHTTAILADKERPKTRA